MKRGRPQVQESSALRKQLLEYWGKNYSQAYAAELADVNIKTVCLYYREFNEKMVEDTDQDFIQQQKAVKELTLKQMDKLIEESKTQLEEIKAKCGEDPDNSSWDSIRASIIKDQMLFINEKANLAITPTLDISLDALVEEKIANETDPDTTTPKR